MRTNDHQMIWSVILLSASIVVYGAFAYAVSTQGLGIMLAMILLHLILLTIALLGNIVANRR